MKTSKRKTRSDKFPLALHPTGQYCKKSQQYLKLPALRLLISRPNAHVIDIP